MGWKTVPVAGSGGGGTGAGIDDGVSAVDKTWSSQKIEGELNDKSDVNHDHEWPDIKKGPSSTPDEIDQAVVDVANKSDVGHDHAWSEITGKPAATPNDIDEAVLDAHEHLNKMVLDFLDGPGNTLTYKGQPIDGYRAVATLADRDAIPYSERKDGMLCLVLADGSMYYLKGGVDNAFWEIFSVAAGGATSASSLHYTPTGNLTATDVQAAIDELESTKVNSANVYTKAETDLKLGNHTHSYNSLSNKPDLSQLHGHTNKGTLDKFSEVLGELSWNGKTLGNMIGDVYDSDGDGLVDKAATLQGLLATIQQLNYSVGLTGNIQQQINAISNGTVYKGTYPTYADMLTAISNPSQGFWVFIEQDETKSGANTQYYHDGTDWVYGGGAAKVGGATDTVLGGVALAGALENPAGTAQNPLLNSTGVTAGTYKNATLVIEEDGRVSHAVEGASAFINDQNSSLQETWSSSKIEDELSGKSAKNHVHPELHSPNMLGDVELDTNTVSDKRVIMYNAVTGKAEWKESQGGKVYVGSRVIAGDYRLTAGANISLFIDEATRTITINSTYQGGGGNSVPTLTEITHTVEVPGNGTVKLDLDAAFNKYDIRTVNLTNTEGLPMDVSIYDMAAGGRRIYFSNQEISTYDIVNVPCHDKDQSQKLHLVLKNYGPKATTASLVVTTTNLV